MDLNSLMNVITGLLVPCALAIFGWASKLQREVTDLRVKFAEDAVKHTTIQPILDDLEWLKRTMIRVAAKLGVETER